MTRWLPEYLAGFSGCFIFINISMCVLLAGMWLAKSACVDQPALWKEVPFSNRIIKMAPTVLTSGSQQGGKKAMATEGLKPRRVCFHFQKYLYVPFRVCYFLQNQQIKRGYPKPKAGTLWVVC